MPLGLSKDEKFNLRDRKHLLFSPIPEFHEFQKSVKIISDLAVFICSYTIAQTGG